MPENSLAAFRDSVTRGADGAELDVQLSHDGEVIVYHDYRLKPEITRSADGRWLTKPTPRIKDLTLAELHAYDIGRCDPASAYARDHADVTPRDGESIPTLAEVVGAAKEAKQDFWLQVELKTSFSNRDEGPDPIALAEATVAVLRAQNYLHRTIFVGFDWPGLLHAKKLSPQTRCWFTTLAQSWFEEGTPPPEDDPPAEPALQMLRHWAKTGTSPWAGGYDAVNYGGSLRRAKRENADDHRGHHLQGRRQESHRLSRGWCERRKGARRSRLPSGRWFDGTREGKSAHAGRDRLRRFRARYVWRNRDLSRARNGAAGRADEKSRTAARARLRRPRCIEGSVQCRCEAPRRRRLLFRRRPGYRTGPQQHGAYLCCVHASGPDLCGRRHAQRPRQGTYLRRCAGPLHFAGDAKPVYRGNRKGRRQLADDCVWRCGTQLHRQIRRRDGYSGLQVSRIDRQALLGCDASVI